jgi:Rad3-related DNA helicase
MNENEFKQLFPFEKPRVLQQEIIEKIIGAYEDGYKHVVINAPTGIGKSVIGMTIANYFTNVQSDNAPLSTYILTSQKILQDQYTDDFKIPTVKGRETYSCMYDTSKNCKNAKCLKERWTPQKIAEECPNCLYIKARNIAFQSNISIFNYAYFLNMTTSQYQAQTRRKLLILDECHNAEQMLVNFSTVIIDKKECAKLNLFEEILNFPLKSSPDISKFKWLFEKIHPKIIELKESYNNMNLDDFQIKQKNHLTMLCCNISNLRGEYDSNIPCCVIQETDDNIVFKPIFGKGLSKRYLLPYAEKTLSMSATVLNKKKYCRELNLWPDDVKFFNLPSLFPKKNRQIYSLGIGSMSYKNKEKTLPKIMEKTYQILKKYKNKRGIIHTVSYDVAEKIIDYISKKDYKLSKRLIFPKGKNRENNIEYFFKSDKNDLVLISPSLQEGIDLKGEFSNFTIVCKLPFASLGDKWVKQKMSITPIWYTENTIINLVQMTGRSVRTNTDKADTFILDSDFEWFYKRNKNLFPKWWTETLNLKK